MGKNDWAHVRLQTSIHPSRTEPGLLCVDWRLLAKAPGEEWHTRSIVAHGSDRVAGIAWPPTRDDALAAMVGVLMGIRWTE